MDLQPVDNESNQLHYVEWNMYFTLKYWDWKGDMKEYDLAK